MTLPWEVWVWYNCCGVVDQARTVLRASLCAPTSSQALSPSYKDMLPQSIPFGCCSQEGPSRKHKPSLFFPTQLLNQVLNRVTAERNLFDRVVNLRLPGESTH